jgi:hypothetical protein
MAEAPEVALEDYAREVARAREAEALRDAQGRVAGLHLCGVAGGLAPGAARDVFDFARSLLSTQSGGLGWS